MLFLRLIRHVGLEGGPQPFIKSPASMANKTFSEALDENVKWTPELVQELQKMLVESDHVSVCSGKGADQGPPPPPPSGFNSDRSRSRQRRPPPPPPHFADEGRSKSHNSQERGPPPPPNGQRPNIPPELLKMMIVNYPKLVKEYEPPQFCNVDENVIDS